MRYVGRKRSTWLHFFSYDRSVVLSLGAFVTGVLLCTFLVREYVANGYALPGEFTVANYLCVTGLPLVVSSFAHFVTTLVFQLAAIRVKPRGLHLAE